MEDQRRNEAEKEAVSRCLPDNNDVRSIRQVAFVFRAGWSNVSR